MVRFNGALLYAKHGSQHLAPSPNSSITLTTGAVSEKPIKGWTVPASYAGGQHSIMRKMALDLEPIRVNVISPGVVDTEFWGWMPKEQFKGFVEGLRRATTTGEVGKPEDVAEAYIYCVRDRNLSGSVLLLTTGKF